MQSRHGNNSRRDTRVKGSAPSLLDLCVETAIKNVRYLGDVGETDGDLLARILPHCNVDQLTTIENLTQDRDLSPITDTIWRGLYKLEFGLDNLNQAIQKMKERKVSYKWRLLYEAKLKDREETLQESLNKMKELYKREGERKQSRQVKLCTKTPPTSNKRAFWGGPSSLNIASTKSGIMKKAKLEFLKSNEVKNLTAVKKNTVQKRPVSLPTIRKPTVPSSNFSASSSKFGNSMGRRY